MLREIIDEAIVNWANGEMTTEKIIDKAEADIKAMLLSEDALRESIRKGYFKSNCNHSSCTGYICPPCYEAMAKAIHQAQMKKIGGQDDEIKAYTK